MPADAVAVAELHQRAARWMEVGARAAALKLYREILVHTPDDVEALRFVALGEADADDADRAFRRLAGLATLTVGDYVRWADHMQSRKRFGQATELLVKAWEIATTPDEKLAVAGAFAAISAESLDQQMTGAETIAAIAGSSTENVLAALLGDSMAGQESRVTALLTSVLERSHHDSDLDALAYVLERSAPRAGLRAAVEAIAALVGTGRRHEARTIWEEIPRPPASMDDPWLLLNYLTMGGDFHYDDGRADLAVDLYKDALDVWRTDVLTRDFAPEALLQIRSMVAPLELQYINSLVEVGRFTQALAEASAWEQADKAAHFPPQPAARADVEEGHEAPAVSRSVPYGAYRSLARAGAYNGLGDNRSFISTLFTFASEIHADEDTHARTPTETRWILLECLIEVNPVQARHLIERAFPDSAADLNRDEILACVHAYRLWADRDEGFAAESGDVVRKELASRLNTSDDHGLDALLALYAGQLHRSKESLLHLTGSDWRVDMLRAVVELELHNAVAAAEHCDAVLASRPFDVDAEILRAEIERELNGAAAARTLAEDIARRRPDDVDAQILVADCCYELAQRLDGDDSLRVDIALLTEAAERYRTAIQLSDNMKRFLEGRGSGVSGRVGSRWLSSTAYQRAVRRGATCAVRAAALIEKRRLPVDRMLGLTRKTLIDSIDDRQTRQRLERSVFHNDLSRARRWLRNFGFIVGFVGGAVALTSMVFPQLTVPWPEEDTLTLLVVFLILALFPTISEFSLPGGLGLKRAALPLLEKSDLQSTELLRAFSGLPGRIIAPSMPPPPPRNPSGQAFQGADQLE